MVVSLAFENAVPPPAPHEVLRLLFDAVVANAQPTNFLFQHLPNPPRGKIVVVGAGKAAASMVRAVEASYTHGIEGVVVTRYGYGAPSHKIKILEAAHPIPDQRSVDAAAEIAAAVQRATADDLILCLVSGGGSSLLCQPAPGLTLQDKQILNEKLLKCGASISEINCVRKHLSAIKGGRLGILNPNAPMLALIMSDVPGDAASEIASGPTVPDDTCQEHALAIVEKYGLALPPSIMAALAAPENETPKPGDVRFAAVENKVVLTPDIALQAAVRKARRLGYDVIYLGDDLQDDATRLGRQHGELALSLVGARNKICIVSGGETSVEVRGDGRGGRNSQYLLSLALTLNGAKGIYALAGDTDGVDGTENNAGAIVTPDFMRAAQAASLDLAAMLWANDAYSAFEALDSLLVTGPTMTNVNDCRIILIEPEETAHEA